MSHFSNLRRTYKTQEKLLLGSRNDLTGAHSADAEASNKRAELLDIMRTAYDAKKDLKAKSRKRDRRKKIRQEA
jgi:hypothetical protein